MRLLRLLHLLCLLHHVLLLCLLRTREGTMACSAGQGRRRSKLARAADSWPPPRHCCFRSSSFSLSSHLSRDFNGRAEMFSRSTPLGVDPRSIAQVRAAAGAPAPGRRCLQRLRPARCLRPSPPSSQPCPARPALWSPQRIMEIRGQIAREWIEELKQVGGGGKGCVLRATEEMLWMGWQWASGSRS